MIRYVFLMKLKDSKIAVFGCESKGFAKKAFKLIEFSLKLQQIEL